jgi:hypothetical protein
LRAIVAIQDSAGMITDIASLQSALGNIQFEEQNDPYETTMRRFKLANLPTGTTGEYSQESHSGTNARLLLTDLRLWIDTAELCIQPEKLIQQKGMNFQPYSQHPHSPRAKWPKGQVPWNGVRESGGIGWRLDGQTSKHLAQYAYFSTGSTDCIEGFGLIHRTYVEL